MSKITVDAKQLAKEMAFVGKLILVNPTNPFWMNVLIEAEGSTLRLTGTDGTNATSTFITLETPTKEPFSAAIAAKKFGDVVKLIEQDKVTLSKSDTRVTLVAGKGKYIFSNAPDAVPSIKQFQKLGGDGETVTVNAGKVTELVKIGNLFTASEDTTKFNLMGVRLVADADKLTVWSMDGQRAVDFSVDDKQENRNLTLFLPKEGASIMADLVDGEELKFTVGTSVIRMECGNRIAMIRKSANENFPAIASFLDRYLEKHEVTMSIESHLLAGAIKRLMIAVDGKLRKVLFKTIDGGISVTTQAPMGGCQEFYEELLGDVQGTGEFNLNAEFVLDYIKLVSGIVTIRYNPSFPNAAVVFTNGLGFRCMISAMK